MGIGGVLILILQIYFYAVLAWVILSWIPTSSEHPLGRVNVFLDQVIYPVILRFAVSSRLYASEGDARPLPDRAPHRDQLLMGLVRGIF